MLRLPNFSTIKQYSRIGALSIQEGLEYIRVSRIMEKREHQIIFGVRVRAGGARLATYLYKGVACVTCSRKGSYFAIENCKWQTTEGYHLNLWGIDTNGNHFLMTSDHIIPKSKGGLGIIQNRQPMCSKCNTKKGNLLPEQFTRREIRLGLKKEANEAIV